MSKSLSNRRKIVLLAILASVLVASPFILLQLIRAQAIYLASHDLSEISNSNAMWLVNGNDGLTYICDLRTSPPHCRQLPNIERLEAAESLASGALMMRFETRLLSCTDGGDWREFGQVAPASQVVLDPWRGLAIEVADGTWKLHFIGPGREVLSKPTKWIPRFATPLGILAEDGEGARWLVRADGLVADSVEGQTMVQYTPTSHEFLDGAGRVVGRHSPHFEHPSGIVYRKSATSYGFFNAPNHVGLSNTRPLSLRAWELISKRIGALHE